ncbi:hypothetical protein BJ980_002315 [Nocardioides daedukensis]|uniref:Uncharacterized protein n=1 Tax=Nocardioides daedukensis TaxID=634462 RepID=A0A7Y9RZ98_9ACTN|nr:hypothetical protein [Nocardioides daedukensis]NYG59392.1 hypothetical protein [Nocardioides daedukensis]
MTDPSDDAVRRLLAGARHDEPIPTDVADRMDAVIDRLSAERDRSDDNEPIPLRRRRVPQFLLAAAAVAAIGFGLSQTSGAGPDASEQGAGRAGDSVTSQEQDQGDHKAGSSSTPNPAQSGALPILQTLDAESLDSLRKAPTSLSDETYSQKSSGAAGGCLSGEVAANLDSAADVRAASYRGQRVAVIFTERDQGGYLAEVHACSGARTPLATLVVPAGE